MDCGMLLGASAKICRLCRLDAGENFLMIPAGKGQGCRFDSAKLRWTLIAAGN